MTNASLQKKTAARTVATQCLYQQAITGEKQNIGQHIAALKHQLAGNTAEQKLQVGMAVEPHYPLIEALVRGVIEREQDINTLLDSALSDNWKRERMSPLLVALLQCGIFEMAYYKDVKPRIVVNEYTKLARSFFDEKEVNFVHALLATLGKNYDE
ncbi:MAG: transcription antitermination factor NusB [Alphaproteobacteria bacterium]